jgi:hypothetical protein
MTVFSTVPSVVSTSIGIGANRHILLSPVRFGSECETYRYTAQ